MLASGNLRADNLLFDSPDAKPDAISLDWSLGWPWPAAAWGVRDDTPAQPRRNHSGNKAPARVGGGSVFGVGRGSVVDVA